MFRASVVGGIIVTVGVLSGCSSEPQKPVAGSGDSAFTLLVTEILNDTYVRYPTQATYLGIHTFDSKLEDYSRGAEEDIVATARAFQKRLDAIDPATLSPANQLDREFVMHALESRVLIGDVIRPWAKDPDSYSTGITNTGYIMIKRAFAPAEERLKSLIAREKAMPGALAEARKNLDNPPKIYTEIAIDQLDGDIELFKSAIPMAFEEVKDQALLGEFKTANAAVIKALGEYKTWLQKDLLPKSNGQFAYGADVYRKRLMADEMIDTPLDDLLKAAEADLHRNQQALAETAKKIAPNKSLDDVMKMVEQNHPSGDKLIASTQGTLDELGRFLTDKHIITVPGAAQARVQETPPFMRATTFASMDTPGPFETKATEAYYNVTLPDPKWPAAKQKEYMEGWYYPLISNVSVHEAWPGHYLQFLYAKQFPSAARKVFSANTNVEGWAHYCEQMVIEQGFHADDPTFHLAQIQDALLRDVRFIVGIKMHTQGMTMKEAEDMFVKEGFQTRPTAEAETKRGTSDALYGYYTMGKLMIMKLRDDYKTKLGPEYSLQRFHDDFIKLGPLQLPLMRKAMGVAPGAF